MSTITRFGTFFLFTNLNGCLPELVNGVKWEDPADTAVEEECDGVDNDGDGLVDEGLETYTSYVDNDGDGFGSEDPTLAFVDCDPYPTLGLVSTGGDCDDNDPSVFPMAADGDCNGVDNDCDSSVDEDADASEFALWYTDRDEDSYGDPLESWYTCMKDPNTNSEGFVYVENSDDCNSDDATVHDYAPDDSIGCLDPDDDGVTNRGDETPFYLASGGGQSIDQMETDEISVYTTFIDALSFSLNFDLDETSVGDCWEWYSGGDYGTFSCLDQSLVSSIYAPIPTYGLDESYIPTYSAEAWVRMQEESIGFVMIPSDECMGETMCTEAFEALVVLHEEQAAYLVTYGSSDGLSVEDVIDLSTVDYNADGANDGSYASDTWYQWNFDIVEDELRITVGEPQKTADAQEVLFGSSLTLGGGNVVFISMGSENLEVHQPNWQLEDWARD